MTSKLTPIARKLRRNSTEAERKLWQRLRDRQLHERKFRRQAPIGPYVVDFVDLEGRLVIELDGGQHADDERDRLRTAQIESLGFRVLRFWNNDVLENMDGVLAVISGALSENSETTPSP